MAAITHTLTALPGTRDMQGVSIATWGPTTLDADTFSAVQCASASDKSVQVYGTFDGATITITGSIDGTNYVALASATFTAAGIKTISENVRYIKPATSNDGAGTSLSIALLVVNKA